MNIDGFMHPMIDMTLNFYKIGMKQMSWMKKIQGTKVIVTRLTQDSKYKRVHGSTVSSTLALDKDVQEFDYVIIINFNDMMKIFQKSINQFDFYDNENTLQLGDLVRFTDNGQLFRFKVIDIQSFSNKDTILNRYTLSGLAEVNSEEQLPSEIKDDYPDDDEEIF